MPSPVEALPWGSMSRISTRLPTAASAVARFTAVVVLPTPPFWLAMAIIRAREKDGWSAAAFGRKLSSGTENLADTEDGPGGIGGAGEPVGPHLPGSRRFGQFLFGLPAFGEQAACRRRQERRRKIQQKGQRRQ